MRHDMTHDGPFKLQLHTYVDGELDEQTCRVFETHLAQCPRCEAEIAAIRSLKRVLAGLAKTVTLPAGLEDRVRRGVDRVVHRRNVVASLAWPAGGCLAAAIVAAFFMVQTSGVSAMVSDHAHWLVEGQVSAISSPEPVALKSWLNARLAFPPPVLARAGDCSAVGARIGTFGHRQASTVTYHCGTHVVDVYAVADRARTVASAAVPPHLIATRDVNVVGWKRGRLDCYAVSDLPKSQLVDLAQYIQDHAREG